MMMGLLLLRVLRNCVTHVRLFPQAAWVGTATIFGFPVLFRLRHLIKQARIESIMKGH
jgi:hypothetical protein